MNHRQSFSTIRNLLLCSLAAFFLGGCGGDHLDPVLGTPGQVVTLPTPVTPPPVVPDVPVVPADTARPTVVRTIPAPGETNVAVNRLITAVFSEEMKPSTITGTSFTVTNVTTSASVAGTVTYSASSKTATFTPATVLPNASQFTATITTAATDVAGNPLAGSAASSSIASDHTWSFTTGLASDTTRPTVSLTVPTPGQTDVPVSQPVTAKFSEAMNPGTIPGSFTVTDTVASTAVAGTAAYSAASSTVTFTPSSPLPFSRTFTATITSAATDLAGNPLVGNTAPPATGSYTWNFISGANPDNTPPRVLSLYPTSPAPCAARSVIVGFSEPMDPDSINLDTFQVTVDGARELGPIEYDPVTDRAELIIGASFPTNSNVVVTVKSGDDGVKDAAGNEMVQDSVQSFTAGSQVCLTGVDLGAAKPFGGFGGSAGMTNQNLDTVINGDIGSTSACSLFTGFHDRDYVFTETPLNEGQVNGSVYCSPATPGAGPAGGLAIAEAALLSARSAYDELQGKPPGTDPGAGALGGRTLFPGVYTSAGGSFSILGSDLTLDAQGNSDAVWVFQMASTLTVGVIDPLVPIKVLLINGAEARNVYWAVGSSATINEGSEMVGTIIAAAAITLSKIGTPPITTLAGRAIALVESVTMVDTVITVPTDPAD